MMTAERKRMTVSQNSVSTASGSGWRRTTSMVAFAALLVGLGTVSTSSQSVMPTPRQQFLTNNGDPCASCKLYAYAAGTNTPQNTYSDFALSVPNANPIVLDSAGRATVFLANTLSYKFALNTAADVPIWTVDNITGQLAGIVTITAAATRGLQITRTNAEAGLSIASTGGAGKTYGLASTTVGSLVIRDDADGTPNITINASDQIAMTATGGVLITGNSTVTGSQQLGSLTVTGGGQLAGAERLTAAISPPQITSDQNDYNPTGLATSRVLRLTSNASRNITGIAAQPGGTLLTLINVNAEGSGFAISFTNESAASAQGNRFIIGSSGGISPGDAATIWYDALAARWRRLH